MDSHSLDMWLAQREKGYGERKAHRGRCISNSPCSNQGISSSQIDRQFSSKVSNHSNKFHSNQFHSNQFHSSKCISSKEDNSQHNSTQYSNSRRINSKPPVILLSSISK